MSTPQFEIEKSKEGKQKDEKTRIADLYKWYVKRALECQDDRGCALSFMSDMGKNKQISDICGPLAAIRLLQLKGRELREFICDFKVPGADNEALKKLIKTGTVKP